MRRTGGQGLTEYVILVGGIALAAVTASTLLSGGLGAAASKPARVLEDRLSRQLDRAGSARSSVGGATGSGGDDVAIEGPRRPPKERSEGPDEGHAFSAMVGR